MANTSWFLSSATFGLGLIDLFFPEVTLVKIFQRIEVQDFYRPYDFRESFLSAELTFQVHSRLSKMGTFDEEHATFC